MEFLTERSIFRHRPFPRGSRMLVRNRMTPDVFTVSPETTIAEALTVTRAQRIRHLPVLENERLVGLVTDRDLRLAMPPIWAADHAELTNALNHRHVREVMTTEIVSVRSDMPVEDAAKLLYTHRIGCVPVVDDDRLVGILTETDLLRAFTELFGSQGPSVRVEVQMHNRPGELARVVRLIGIENRVNIVGMVVPPLAGTGDNVAIIHLQTQNARPVIQALRKCGYRVGSPSLDTDPEVDAPHDDLDAMRSNEANARTFAEL
jgi:acetoin utilization protein AcuB